MITDKMKVEVWTDIMCPYCYIGKKFYEKALSQFEHADDIELEWKAFQLNPELPDKGNGVSLIDYFNNHVGIPEEKYNSMFEVIKKLAEDAEVGFNLPNAIAANTHDAHRLIKLAAKKGLDSKVLNKLSKAYFEEAKDYSDHSLLVSIGKEVGMDEDEILNMLNSDDFRYEIKQDIQEAANLGFDTVPTFLIDRRQAIVGSEPVALYLEVLNKAYNVWKARNDEQIKPEVIVGKSCSADGTCEI